MNSEEILEVILEQNSFNDLFDNSFKCPCCGKITRVPQYNTDDELVDFSCEDCKSI